MDFSPSYCKCIFLSCKTHLRCCIFNYFAKKKKIWFLHLSKISDSTTASHHYIKATLRFCFLFLGLHVFQSSLLWFCCLNVWFLVFSILVHIYASDHFRTGCVFLWMLPFFCFFFIALCVCLTQPVRFQVWSRTNTCHSTIFFQ